MTRDVEEECRIKFKKYNISDGDKWYEEKESRCKGESDEDVVIVMCI